MLPEDWPYECWGLIAFSTHPTTLPSIRDWESSPEEARRQSQLIRSAVAPLLHGRHWFFRRRGLEHDVPQCYMAPAYITVYVKLDPQRGNPELDLRELRAKLRRKRRDVAVVRCWNGSYGTEPEYGPPVARAALRQCCCDMTSAFVHGGDPYAVAASWIKQSEVRDEGAKHWLSWIVGEDEMQVGQELDRRLATWRGP